MRIFLSVSDRHLWALRPCLHLLEKYWPEHPPLFIAGYSAPKFDLPEGSEFFSIGAFADYPFNHWSDGVITALRVMGDEQLIWWMEDFWPVRRIDARAVRTLNEYLQAHTDIARIDLTTDRLYAPSVHDVGAYGSLDLIENALPVPYLLSFQPGLWRRDHLLHYLAPNESPYDAEIKGSARMNNDKAHVLGTRQSPVKILIAIQQGKLTLDGGYQVPRPTLRPADWTELVEAGYLERT